MYELESYQSYPGYPGRITKDAAAYRLGQWPTGFSGGGWLVRNAAGEIVFASAWRIDCLEYVEQHEGGA